MSSESPRSDALYRRWSVMTEEPQTPHWQLTEQSGKRTVRLRGYWNLLTRGVERQRVATELREIQRPRLLTWDLTDVQVIDSAGALLLWHLWDESLPEGFHCRPEHRQWFTRLGKLSTPSGRPAGQGLRPLSRLGGQIVGMARDGAGMLQLIGQLMLDLGYTLLHPRLTPWKEISASIYRTGATALPLLGTVGVLIGIVMTYQLAISLQKFGANTMIVSVLGLSILRELGPVITALIVIGRTGSAITAGIGVMHVTEEFDALRAFGASPTQRLIMPSVIGMAVSIPLLVIWTDFAGLLGGIIASDFSLGVGYRLFIERLPESVPWVNFWIGLGKGVLFGFVIATVSSYFGLKVQANTESLRQETTNSVVASLTVILLLDATLGALLTNVGLV